MGCEKCIHFPVCQGTAAQRGEVFYDQFDKCAYATTLADFKQTIRSAISQTKVKETIIDDNTMVKRGGRVFRCRVCGSNLFTHLQRSSVLHEEVVLNIYRCHGCRQEYEGE